MSQETQMTVRKVIEDNLGKDLFLIDQNGIILGKSFYDFPVEEIEKLDDKVVIHIRPEEGKYVRANKKLDVLMEAALMKIREELDIAYFEKHHKKAESPFDNTNVNRDTKAFLLRSYDWNIENDPTDAPNFEWGPIRVYWYKQCPRAMAVFTKEGYDTPEVYTQMLRACVRFIRKSRHSSRS